MIKVLVHQETIPHYRIEIFNLLAQKVNLTVIYTNGNEPKNTNFRVIKVKKYKIPKIGYFLSKRFYKELKNKDVLIHMLTDEYIDLNNIRFFNKNIKTIVWGIGVPASYEIRYDDLNIGCQKYLKMINKADAALFYSDYPLRKYSKMGVELKKLFVANNTVKVDNLNNLNKKDIILFVGSLYKQKKIDELLKAYKEAYDENNNIPPLILIGDGELKEKIKLWIDSVQLDKKIKLTGGIYEEKELASYFIRAILCISPDQAGLSVLKSMGYGVPYVTRRNAITGGEIFNISDGINGIFYDNYKQLVDIILNTIKNKEKYITFGKRAYEYYWEKRTPENMVAGFINAINYVYGEK